MQALCRHYCSVNKREEQSSKSTEKSAHCCGKRYVSWSSKCICPISEWWWRLFCDWHGSITTGTGKWHNEQVWPRIIAVSRRQLSRMWQFWSYPLVKKLFVQHNVVLPSSAPVEHLFSFAGMITRPHRRSLSDKTFKQLLLLKAN